MSILNPLGVSLSSSLGLDRALGQRREEAGLKAQIELERGKQNVARITGEKRRKASKKRGLFELVGTLAGAGIGAFFGPAAKAAGGKLAGATLGAKLGQAAGGVVSGAPKTENNLADVFSGGLGMVSDIKSARATQAEKKAKTDLDARDTEADILVKEKTAAKKEAETQRILNPTAVKTTKEAALQFKLLKDMVDAGIDPNEIAKIATEKGIPKSLIPKPKLSPQQSLTLGFYERANNTQIELEALREDGFTPESVLSSGRSLLPNIFQSESRQSYERAKLDFITANLRRESGAAISATEEKNEDLKFFPQKGDKRETIRRKIKARQVAIDNLKRDSGPAFSEGPRKFKGLI